MSSGIGRAPNDQLHNVIKDNKMQNQESSYHSRGSGGRLVSPGWLSGSWGVHPVPGSAPWLGSVRAVLIALGLLTGALSPFFFPASASPAGASAPSATSTSAAAPKSAGASAAALELVESFPIETSLDHPDIPQAYDVWKEMIDGARKSIDLAEFYVSDQAGSKLGPVLAALEAAGRRGVRVRFLSEKKFYKTYPEILDRLKADPGVELRLYDVAALMGGVLHAKYFIVDERDAYLGSQNFDWRSLSHIQELGVRVRQSELVRALSDVFETDWSLAGGAVASTRHEVPTGGYHFPVTDIEGGDTLKITPVFSPDHWLPDESLYDLPRLVEMINSAHSTVRVQLLTYKAQGNKRYFDTLETALRAAAARGVSVQLLLSDWCQRAGTIEGLQSLKALPGIDVRLVTIPQWSGGFIPYARTVHAKYLVCDDDKAWVGTSNWEWDYFHTNRNVGLIVQGREFAGRLNQFFLDGWNGPYTRPVDPCGTYTAPRIGE
jgi:phosphatidylserine/phosphatidylglycerophosphate/cardiolipin synthase-like enzyme